MVIGIRSRGYGLLAAVLCLLLILAAAPVVADYQESFRKGMQAYDRKNWSGALEWMARAASERNTESRSKVNLYGMRFEHYLPHYYMGVAHFESGDPAAADAEWQISQRQGVIQKTPQNRELQKYLKQLEEMEISRPRQLDGALTAAQNEIDRAAAAASELDRLQQDTAAGRVFQQDPSLATGRANAADLLDSARGALKRGRDNGDLASASTAKDQAAQARTRFERIGQNVNQRARELRTETARQEAAEQATRDAAALGQAVQAARTEIEQAAAAESALNRLRQDQIGGRVLREQSRVLSSTPPRLVCRPLSRPWSCPALMDRFSVYAASNSYSTGLT